MLTGFNVDFVTAIPSAELDRIVAASKMKGVRFQNWTGAFWMQRLSETLPIRGDWYSQAAPLAYCIDFANRHNLHGTFDLPYGMADYELQYACELIEQTAELPYSITEGGEMWNNNGRWRAHHMYYRTVAGGTGEVAAWRGYAARLRKLACYAGQRANVFANVQCMRPQIADYLLNTLDIADTVNTLAIAPYIAPPHRVPITITESAETLLSKCFYDLENEVTPAIHAHAILAQQHGINFMVYEANTHFIGNQPAIVAADKSTEMLDLLRNLHYICDTAGATQLYWYKLTSIYETASTTRFGLIQRTKDGQTIHHPKSALLY